MDEQFDKETVQSDNMSSETAEEIVEQTEEKPFSLGKEIFEWIYTIGIALVIVCLLKGFVFEIVKVDGPSMNPTLQHNDRLIVTKLGYTPEQGDIVILDSTYQKRTDYYERLEMTSGEELSWFRKMLSYPNLPDSLKRSFYVKRIIALPGQTVDIQNGRVFVDGEALDEPYIEDETAKTDPRVVYPVTVNEGYVFVMGDNRDNSTDSRSSSLGQVPIDALLGKSQIRIFPFNALGLTK